MANKNPRRATVAILVTTRPRLQLERTLVHKFDQPLGRPVTEGKFRGALGLMCGLDPEAARIADRQ